MMPVLTRVRCPACRYTWLPRVLKPKRCPRCMRRLDTK